MKYIIVAGLILFGLYMFDCFTLLTTVSIGVSVILFYSFTSAIMIGIFIGTVIILLSLIYGPIIIIIAFIVWLLAVLFD